MTEITKEQFPNWLHTRLKEKKIKRLQFADMLGVHRTSISKWISGSQYPHPATLKQIMDILGDDDTATQTNPNTTGTMGDGECIPDPRPEDILDIYKMLPPEDQLYIRGMITCTYMRHKGQQQ